MNRYNPRSMRWWETAEQGSPADAELQPCNACGRKTDGTKIGSLRLWKVRPVPHSGRGLNWHARIDGAPAATTTATSGRSAKRPR